MKFKQLLNYSNTKAIMKIHSIFLVSIISTVFLFSCGPKGTKISDIPTGDSIVQKESGSFINNELTCQNYMNGKTFFGKIYRIEISSEGKLKVYNKSDNSVFFESTPGKQFEIGELKNDGRWISIRGGEWVKQPINGLMGQLDTKFDFVLLKNETLLIPSTGDIYTLTATSPTESENKTGSSIIADSANSVNDHD